MDWDNKFSSIVQETESNLAKVKEQLGSSQLFTGHSFTNGSSASSFMKDSYYLPQVESKLGSGLSTLSAHPASLSLAGGNLSNQLGQTSVDPLPQLEQSPGVIMVLQDRLDDQARAIENLFRTVKRLEDEKEGYHRKVKELRDELNSVLSRLSERGVDLHTERKLDQWRRDVAADMNSLHRQLQIYTSRREDGSAMGASLSVTREVQDVRRHMQDECDSFRREMDNFRSRLAQLEPRLTAVDSDYKEVTRRQDRLDQHLTEVLNHQHMTSNDLSKTIGDVSQDKDEITQLRSSYISMRDKLNLLENHLSDEGSFKSSSGKSSKQTGSGKQYKPPVKTNMLSPATTDLDLSSDSDLSDFSVHDYETAKKHPDNEENDDEEDYLLTDLNLTTDDLSSDEDTLDLEDLQ